MVKEYWKQNRKDYLIFGLLLILVTTLSLILTSGTEFKEILSGTINETTAAEVTRAAPNQELIFLMILTYFLGFLSLAMLGYQIYIYLKPFIKKQLHQTVSIGNNPVNYLLIHVAFLIALALLEVFIFNISDFFQTENGILPFLKSIISNIALPLWMLAIPITIMNGKVLTDVSPRKRVLAIVLSYLLFWVIISMLSFIPYLQNSFTILSQATIATRVDGALQTSKIAILEILIDFIGIFVFIIAFNLFKKNYEIII